MLILFEPAAMSHLKHRMNFSSDPSFSFNSLQTISLSAFLAFGERGYLRITWLFHVFQMNALAFCCMCIITILWSSPILYSAFSWSIVDSLWLQDFLVVRTLPGCFTDFFFVQVKTSLGTFKNGARRCGDVAQWVECLHNIHEALGWHPALYKPGVAVHSCNSSIWEGAVGGPGN